jgi:hypothetical protein
MRLSKRGAVSNGGHLRLAALGISIREYQTGIEDWSSKKHFCIPRSNIPGSVQ